MYGFRSLPCRHLPGLVQSERKNKLMSLILLTLSFISDESLCAMKQETTVLRGAKFVNSTLIKCILSALQKPKRL